MKRHVTMSSANRRKLRKHHQRIKRISHQGGSLSGGIAPMERRNRRIQRELRKAA